LDSLVSFRRVTVLVCEMGIGVVYVADLPAELRIGVADRIAQPG
jgi:hypothetical protein